MREKCKINFKVFKVIIIVSDFNTLFPSMTNRDEKVLGVFEKSVAGKMYGAVRMGDEYRRRKKHELHI